MQPYPDSIRPRRHHAPLLAVVDAHGGALLAVDAHRVADTEAQADEMGLEVHGRLVLLELFVVGFVAH